MESEEVNTVEQDNSEVNARDLAISAVWSYQWTVSCAESVKTDCKTIALQATVHQPTFRSAQRLEDTGDRYSSEAKSRFAA